LLQFALSPAETCIRVSISAIPFLEFLYSAQQETADYILLCVWCNESRLVLIYRGLVYIVHLIRVSGTIFVSNSY